MRNPCQLSAFVAAMLLFLVPASTFATVISWVNTSGGSWNVANNWSPAVVPGDGDLANIIAPGTYTVTINSNVTVGGINLAGSSGFRTLQVNNSTVTATAGYVVGTRGILSLSSSSVAGGGTLDLSGTLEALGPCSIVTLLTTATTSVINLLPSANLGFQTGFTNRGEIHFGTGGTERLSLFGGTFINDTGGLISAPYSANGGIWGSFENRGTLALNFDFWLQGGPTVNSGTITSSPNGTLHVLNSFTTSGTIHLNFPSRLWVEAGSFLQTAGIIDGGGIFTIRYANAVFSSNPIVSQLEVLYGSHVTFPSPITHGAGMVFNYLIGSTVTAPGFTVVTGGHTLELASSTLDVPVATINGPLLVSGNSGITGTINSLPGSRISIVSGAEIQGSGYSSSLSVGQGFTNNSEINLEPMPGQPATLAIAGQLVNAPGATVASIATNPSDTTTHSYVNATLDNQGLLAVNANLTLDYPSAQHVNTGFINVGEGDLVIRQSGTSPAFQSSAGTVYINPGRTLHVENGAMTVSGGSVTGGGNLRLTAGAAANFSVFPLLSALDMQDATGTFPGTFNTDDTSIDLEGSNFAGSITNTAGHTIRVLDSTIQGAVTNLGTLDIQGASSLLAFLYNDGLLTIQDGLLLSSGDTGQQNHGVIRVFGGTFSVAQTAAGFFTNQDTLKVYPGANLQVTGGEFRNEVSGVLAGGGAYNMSGTTFINNGTINPGASPGMMAINGNVTMGPTSVLNMELGGVAPGTEYDQILVTGNAVLNGTINVSLANGFFPQTGQAFDLMTCGSHSGQFTAVNGTGVGFGNMLAFVPQPRPSDPIRLTTVHQAWSSIGNVGPMARARHVAAYDGFANRLIVFGGLGSGGEFNDTWILEGANGSGGFWEQLTITGTRPPVRQGHAAAYDATNNRLIVYGGYSADYQTAYSDVWVLSNANGLGGVATWTQLTPAGGTPGERVGGSVGYNPASNRLILFGGVHPTDACTYASNDVWILTNANGLGGTPVWTLLPTSGLPPFPRSGAVMAYDNATNRLIVHAGTDACAAAMAEAYYLTHADGLGGTPTWTTLPLSNPAPPARTDHAGIYDAMTDRLVTFGGIDASGTELLDDVFMITGATNAAQAGWSSLPSNPGSRPSPRFGHSASWDPATRRMILFGGDSNGGLSKEVWVLSLDLEPGPVSGVTDPAPPGPAPDPELEAGTSGFGFRKAPWPNPTNGPVSLTFGMPRAAEVSVDVFDVLGRHVRRLRSGSAPAGLQEIRWNGEGNEGPVPSGIYYVVMQSGTDRDARRIVVTR